MMRAALVWLRVGACQACGLAARRLRRGCSRQPAVAWEAICGSLAIAAKVLAYQTVQSWTDATFQNTLFCGYTVTIWDGRIVYGTYTSGKSVNISPYFAQTCQPLYYS